MNKDFKEKMLLLDKLVKYCCEDLKIKRPKITLINNDSYVQEHKSFGGYMPGKNHIITVIKNRNLADVSRTVVHELKHAQQDQLGQLTSEAGRDGDKFENEANSYAGIIMRKFGRENPQIYSGIL